RQPAEDCVSLAHELSGSGSTRVVRFRARAARMLAFSPALPHKVAPSGHNSIVQGLRMIDFAAARRMMVDGQVRTADVTDLRLIAAMLELPRARFVPPSNAGLAYID